MKTDDNLQAPAQWKKLLDRKITARELIFLSILVLCLSPFITPPVALLLGGMIAWFVGHPYLHLNHKAIHLLLQVSVVGLGFGMNAGSSLKAGREGVMLTAFTITGTLLAGFFTGRFLGTDKKTSYLVSAGTAICGGSAIAAISPVIKAQERQISVAVGTVFILNAIALFLFPVIGHVLQLTEHQFGLWCAIAIHDTSSVVGAAGKYGPQALETATTVKLARALWIIPVTFISGSLFKNPGRKIRIPWFIGLFIFAIIVNTYLPSIAPVSHYVATGAKAGLTLTLFLIGCGLSPEALRTVGFRPLLQGAILWILVSLAGLWAVIHLP